MRLPALFANAAGAARPRLGVGVMLLLSLLLLSLFSAGATTAAAAPQAQMADFSESIQDAVARVLPSVVQIITAATRPSGPGSVAATC